MEKELPKNWVECTLNDLALIQSGGTPSRANKNYWDGNIPWIKISDIKDLYVNSATEFITEEGLANSAARIFPKGTILFTIFATIGRIGILNIDATTNQAIAGITPTKLINHKYITYSLIDLSNSISEFGKGVAQKNINQAILKDTIIQLPPLAEQNRIVEKLDRLFGQLEVIKSSMEKIPVLLKSFRQQVLTQAVTGKLTEEWREGKDLEEWKEGSIEDFLIKKGIFDGPFGSHLKTEDYLESGNVRVIRLENIDSLKFNDDKNVYVSDEKYTRLIRHEVFEGDIIFSSFISERIRACILPFSSKKMIAKADCFCLRNDKQVLNTEFFSYVLVNPLMFEQLLKEVRGATRPRINTTILKKAQIIVPPIKEQQEIVSRVESLFAKADAIEEKYKNLKAKIETLPQTILHKAFKGELTKQLESDGDARDLLEEIMALKSGDKPKKAVSKKHIQPDDEVLRTVAEESSSYPALSAREKKVQRKMLATYIINRSLEDQSFGKTKFEKLLHLVEYHILQRDLNQNYSVQAAGPYDGGFTKTFWDEVLKSKWFALEEKGSLRRIVSGSNQEKSLKDYGYFSDEEKKKINDFIKIFDHNNYEKPEIVSTLYAVWNNRIKKNESITDDLLKEDFLNWDSGKARYKDRLDKTLEWMKENGVVPNGWGKEIKRAKK